MLTLSQLFRDSRSHEGFAILKEDRVLREIGEWSQLYLQATVRRPLVVLLALEVYRRHDGKMGDHYCGVKDGIYRHSRAFHQR